MDLDLITLRHSFNVILSHGPTMARRFYDIFFDRHPECARLFDSSNRGTQERMLAEVLGTFLQHLDDTALAATTLRALGARHSRYGVTPQMYDWFGDCLLAAMRETAGAAWNEEVDEAWRDAFVEISRLMQQGAEPNEGAC